ncbi:MAG: hypothetical protein GF335_02195 [Candidatus Moranbacteria bacterium]|nr:hypothetical protein [Candidatus Moranbacteria bacterium]
MFVKSGFFLLGRSIQSVSGFDRIVQREIENWTNGFCVKMQVKPKGAFLILTKNKNRLIYSSKNVKKADLTILFRNLEAGFMLLSAQMGTPQAYAQNRLEIYGPINRSMQLIRILNRVQTYLLPKFLVKKTMTKVPEIPFLYLFFQKLRLYSLGILLGI